MPDRSPIPVPWRLMLRRTHYQVVPVTTMDACTALAAWLWTRDAHTATASGEVNAVRVSVEAKTDGMLQELPQPVRVFDTVRSGQTVARLDLDLLDKQLESLRS